MHLAKLLATTTEDMLVMAWQILYTKTENNKAILFSVMAEGAAKARVRVSIMGPYLCGSLRPSSTHAHYQSRRNSEAEEELLQSVSNLIFSKHCRYRSRGVRGVKRPEIL